MGSDDQGIGSQLINWAESHCDKDVLAELMRRIGGHQITEKSFWTALNEAQAWCEIKDHKPFSFANLRCNS